MSNKGVDAGVGLMGCGCGLMMLGLLMPVIAGVVIIIYIAIAGGN